MYRMLYPGLPDQPIKNTGPRYKEDQKGCGGLKTTFLNLSLKLKSFSCRE